MKAIRFHEFGGSEVLRFEDVERPVPGAGQVLVRVRAAGINPGESKIREGLLHARWPATFPSGQGSDLAGVVERLGPGVTTVAAGDEVIGWVDTRSAQAEYVVVDADNLAGKPAEVPWEVAGALGVVGFTAWAAVRAVNLKTGDTVAVSGAAGGVGSLTVQLARRAGATVVGIAGPDNLEWLREHGAIPVNGSPRATALAIVSIEVGPTSAAPPAIAPDTAEPLSSTWISTGPTPARWNIPWSCA